MEAAFGSGETWNNYFPVNSTVYAPSNIVRLRIPKANYICDLSRAFLRIRTNLPFSAPFSSATGSTIRSKENPADAALAPASGTVRNATLANLNAGALFDIVDLQINGQKLYHDDFNQAACRLASFNRSDEWLRTQEQTYINPMTNGEVAAYNQLAYRELRVPAGYTSGSVLTAQREVIVPLPLIFPCFETLNEWPSFAVNDTLEFNLYVSRLYKYMVDLNWVSGDPAHYFVRPVDTAEVLRYQYVSSGGSTYTVYFYPEQFTIDNICLYVPVHNPSAAEYDQIGTMIGSAAGMSYNFRHWNIVSYLSRYKSADVNEQVFTQQVNFNVSTNNIFGVSMLALKPGTEVVFDKPQVSTVQVNLGPWELASNGTHLYDNYNYGGDMLRAVVDNFSQSNLKYYQTINKQVLYEHSITEAQASSQATYRPTGCYFTFYDASPYDELGVCANEFSNLITYKYSISNPIYANSGLENAKTYCALQTLSTFVINSAGVSCFNPDSRQLTTDAINSLGNYSGQYSFRGPHGIPPQVIGMAAAAIPKVISTVVGLARKVKDGIKGLITKIRDHRSRRHMQWMSERLSEDEMKAHYDALLADSYRILPGKWKRTYNSIIAARAPHGVGAVFARHGLFDGTYPVLKPGFRVNPIHRQRVRFGAYGRFLHLLARRISPKMAHGLTSAFHSFGRFLSPVVRRIHHLVTGKIPSVFQPTIDTGRAILEAYLSGKLSAEEAKAAARTSLRAGGEDIMQRLLTEIARRGNAQYKLFTHHGAPDRPRILYNALSQSGRLDWERIMGTNHYIPFKARPAVIA